MFIFTALLGIKDGGYLGLPLSGAFEMRAEEKLPSAHGRLAGTPRVKSNLRTLDSSRSFTFLKHNPLEA